MVVVDQGIRRVMMKWVKKKKKKRNPNSRYLAIRDDGGESCICVGPPRDGEVLAIVTIEPFHGKMIIIPILTLAGGVFFLLHLVVVFQ